MACCHFEALCNIRKELINIILLYERKIRNKLILYCTQRQSLHETFKHQWTSSDQIAVS